MDESRAHSTFRGVVPVCNVRRYVLPLDEKGFVFVSNKNHSWSVKLYDYSGNLTEYDDVKYFDGFSEGLALVKNSAGQIYYINYKGEKIIY